VPYPGHTEIYGALTGTQDYAMMLADGDFRVIHVSTHVSLREACNRVTEDRVYRTILLARDAMLRLGIATPRIGVAGLNPTQAKEDCSATKKSSTSHRRYAARSAEGIDADGPLPTGFRVFPRARRTLRYHGRDVSRPGHIPIKTAGFVMDRKTGRWKSVSGINVTLGLPIIRTSVDHGTAFDQAGLGTASDRRMVEAIRYAVQLSRTAPARPPSCRGNPCAPCLQMTLQERWTPACSSQKEPGYRSPVSGTLTQSLLSRVKES
jgi:4-hydroxythreonine-4-phosphate dehydrogenase